MLAGQKVQSMPQTFPNEAAQIDARLATSPHIQPRRRSDNRALNVIGSLMAGFENNFGELNLIRLETLAHAINKALNVTRDDRAHMSTADRGLIYEATERVKKLLLAMDSTDHEPEGNDFELILRLGALHDPVPVPAPNPSHVLKLPKFTPAGRDSVLVKIWRSLLTTGFARTAQRFIQRLVPAWLFDINRLAVCEVDLAKWHGAKPDSNWNYRFATRDDAELLMSRGLSRFEVDRFFDHNARGSVLEIDGQLIANNWAVPEKWTCFDWIGFELAPDEVYGASSFVAPDLRGQRIHHQTRSFLYGHLAAEGYRRVITLIEVLNKSSLNSIAHKPWQYLGFLSYVRVLVLVIYKLNNTWGMGFWSQSRPLKVTYQMLLHHAPKTKVGPTPVPFQRNRRRRRGGIVISEGWRRQISTQCAQRGRTNLKRAR